MCLVHVHCSRVEASATVFFPLSYSIMEQYLWRPTIPVPEIYEHGAVKGKSFAHFFYNVLVQLVQEVALATINVKGPTGGKLVLPPPVRMSYN